MVVIYVEGFVASTWITRQDLGGFEWIVQLLVWVAVFLLLLIISGRHFASGQSAKRMALGLRLGHNEMTASRSRGSQAAERVVDGVFAAISMFVWIVMMTAFYAVYAGVPAPETFLGWLNLIVVPILATVVVPLYFTFILATESHSKFALRVFDALAKRN
jgi:hypothetical protein